MRCSAAPSPSRSPPRVPVSSAGGCCAQRSGGGRRGLLRARSSSSTLAGARRRAPSRIRTRGGASRVRAPTLRRDDCAPSPRQRSAIYATDIWRRQSRAVGRGLGVVPTAWRLYVVGAKRWGPFHRGWTCLAARSRPCRTGVRRRDSTRPRRHAVSLSPRGSAARPGARGSTSVYPCYRRYSRAVRGRGRVAA